MSVQFCVPSQDALGPMKTPFAGPWAGKLAIRACFIESLVNIYILDEWKNDDILRFGEMFDRSPKLKQSYLRDMTSEYNTKCETMESAPDSDIIVGSGIGPSSRVCTGHPWACLFCRRLDKLPDGPLVVNLSVARALPSNERHGWTADISLH